MRVKFGGLEQLIAVAPNAPRFSIVGQEMLASERIMRL